MLALLRIVFVVDPSYQVHLDLLTGKRAGVLFISWYCQGKETKKVPQFRVNKLTKITRDVVLKVG